MKLVVCGTAHRCSVGCGLGGLGHGVLGAALLAGQAYMLDINWTVVILVSDHQIALPHAKLTLSVELYFVLFVLSINNTKQNYSLS